MKTYVLMGALLAAGLPGIGCTHVARTRAKAETRLEEHSRAFTTAVVDALQSQPTERRDDFTAAALDFAREDQRIEGVPARPIEVTHLLALHTNLPSTEVAAKQKRAARDLESRTAEAREWVARERRAEERLIAYGATYEAQRNETRFTWFKRGTLLTVVVGGLVALLVFVPAAAPIVGRILAWAVGKIPALAGGLGVVSVKAFDAIVKGIEQTRNSSDGPERLGNQWTAASSGTPAADLRLNLSREMDAAHKALVRQRKSALKL